MVVTANLEKRICSDGMIFLLGMWIKYSAAERDPYAGIIWNSC